MENKDAELKPCPFCGNEAILESFDTRKGYEATICCNSCFAAMHSITYDLKQEAIKRVTNAWNQRVYIKCQVDGEELTFMELIDRYISYRKQLGYWRFNKPDSFKK